MSGPASASVVPLRPWEPPAESSPAYAVCYCCPARVLALDTDRGTITSFTVRALLSTGEPLSVVMPVSSRGRLSIITEAVDHGYPLSWHATPCQLVRVRIGLPVAGSPTPRPFKLLALLPLREVEDVAPFLRLGAEFLHANRVSVRLSSSPCEGRLEIPYPRPTLPACSP